MEQTRQRALALKLTLDSIQQRSSFAFSLIRIDSEYASPAGTFSFNAPSTTTEVKHSRRNTSAFSFKLNPPQLKQSAKIAPNPAASISRGIAGRHIERHTGRHIGRQDGEAEQNKRSSKRVRSQLGCRGEKRINPALPAH